MVGQGAFGDTVRAVGHEAIEIAEREGLTLSKYTDPTEGARSGLSLDEAHAIAAEDPALVYLPVVALLWADGKGEGGSELLYEHDAHAMMRKAAAECGHAAIITLAHGKPIVIAESTSLPHWGPQLATIARAAGLYFE